MIRLLSPVFLLWLAWPSLLAQPGAPGDAAVYLRRTTEPIQIDGDLRESSWRSGTPAQDFWENFPSDSLRAEYQTEVYMTYDDKFLYIGAICHAPGDDYLVPSLRRDFRFSDNDNISFIFDPFRDRTNAFVFGINALGVMREALLSNGANNPRTDWNGSWDNKWRGEARIFDDYWSCELAIPFSTLRYREGETEWFFNCYRNDTQSNTRTTWMQVPQNQMIMGLAFTSRMIWDEPLKKPGANISLIPYVAGAYRQTFLEEQNNNGLGPSGSDPEFDGSFGGDAKVGITPGLNLDLTVNPDFSQVEVDEQVLNLTRFEVLFPERRQFFVENADLFSNFGDQDINPFFSRRIGLGRDTATGDLLQIPIIGGARLSGKLDNNWRVGLLNMQTRNDERTGPGYNYSVASIQRKVFSRSYIGALFVNKQTFVDLEADDNPDLNRYNRVAGLEYNLASPDNVWRGKLFYQHSFSPGMTGGGANAQGSSLTYQIAPVRLAWTQKYVGEHFEAETGFVPRTNYFSIAPEAQLYFYPKGGAFNQHGPGLESEVLWKPGFGKADHKLDLYWEFSLRNTADLKGGVVHESIYLFEPFDPSRTGATPLPDSTAYNYWYFKANYRSDRRRLFWYSLEPEVGQYFNGYRYGMSASLNFRYPPFGGIELNVNYTYVDLPAPYARTGLFLIGPRIDLTFSKKLFLTAFFQYNDQLNNVNINTRLQWRFAPVSDFFLVFTDNYYTDGVFQIRNRAIVGKITYWLNL